MFVYCCYVSLVANSITFGTWCPH